MDMMMNIVIALLVLGILAMWDITRMEKTPMAL